MSTRESHSVHGWETLLQSMSLAPPPWPEACWSRLFSQSPNVQKASPSISWGFCCCCWFVFAEKENIQRNYSREQKWSSCLPPFRFPLCLTYQLFSLNNRFFHPYSLYLDSFNLGIMFIDCSSWKSSLQAYGMRREDTWQDDLQKWHLKPKSAVLDGQQLRGRGLHTGSEDLLWKFHDHPIKFIRFLFLSVQSHYQICMYVPPK